MNIATKTPGTGSALDERDGQAAGVSPPWVEVSRGKAPVRRFTGRQALMLFWLILTRRDGVPGAELAREFDWARRPAAYVHNLRKAGLRIETQWETSSGGARIARYVLRTPLRLRRHQGCL
jgi:hypothetical protein